PGADSLRVQASAAGDPVDNRARRDLVIAANRETIFGFALARPVDEQRRHAAGEEWKLVRRELLLRRIEARNHDDHRRACGAIGGTPQDSGEVAILECNLDALAGWTKVWQRESAAFDRLHVRRA